jgi:anti-sigma regulatory factor (Ser/Thr protein kinase)
MQAEPLGSVARSISRPDGLAHDALFYGSDAEFVGGLVPFLTDGLARGEAAVAAVTGQNIALLRDALGADSAAVTFIDCDDWYQRPTSTVAGWRRLLADATARGHGFIRLVGEVAFGPADRHVTWTRYESALNAVFAGAPAWIVCPYDTRALPAAVLDGARRTHPTVTDPVRRDNERYQPPERLLTSLPEPAPPAGGPPVLVLASVVSVTDLRHRVAGAVRAGGWLSTDRLDDLLIVLTEVASNGLRHGRGRREFRLWAQGWGVVCEMLDEGPGPADPLVGYRPPDDASDGGRGLWIAQQLSDGLSVRYDGGVTRARFAIRSTPRQAPRVTGPAHPAARPVSAG